MESVEQIPQTGDDRTRITNTMVWRRRNLQNKYRSPEATETCGTNTVVRKRRNPRNKYHGLEVTEFMKQVPWSRGVMEAAERTNTAVQRQQKLRNRSHIPKTIEPAQQIPCVIQRQWNLPNKYPIQKQQNPWNKHHGPEAIEFSEQILRSEGNEISR